MKALAIINLCAREYNDVAFARIGRDATSFTATNPNGANWLDWLNDATRSIVLVRPDSGSSTESFPLVAGTRQTLGAGMLRLLDVTRNMGADGATPGRAVRFVEDEAKSDADLDWHIAPNGTVVKEVIYNDKKDPSTFFVSPPALGRYIEVTVSKAPPAILDADVATADFGLDDLYAGPAQAWMLHRAYAMQSMTNINVSRAWQYFQSFFQQLGVKLRAEMFAATASQGAMPPQGAR